MIRPGAVALLSALFCFACSAPEPPAPIPLPARTPEDGIAALLRFAVQIGPESELPDGLVDPDLAERHGAALLDLLESLSGAGEARILGLQRFPEANRAVADAEFDLPGEGFALWSLQLQQGPDGGWFVIWVQGPDGSWPPERTPPGEGLSSSPQVRGSRPR